MKTNYCAMKRLSRKFLSPVMLGKLFETRALRYLQQHGMILVARNIRYRVGEIDLIMQDAANVLVFVEVRARAKSCFGGALASIDTAKRSRLRAAAQWYLSATGHVSLVCRFDVVAFEGARIIWLIDAFSAD
jgi:putative endonuclease